MTIVHAEVSSSPKIVYLNSLKMLHGVKCVCVPGGRFTFILDKTIGVFKWSWRNRSLMSSLMYPSFVKRNS